MCIITNGDARDSVVIVLVAGMTGIPENETKEMLPQTVPSNVKLQFVINQTLRYLRIQTKRKQNGLIAQG